MTIARGRGNSRPSAWSFGPASPGSVANVGAPWDTNRVGRRSMTGS